MCVALSIGRADARSGGLSRFLLFQGNRDRRIRGQAHFLSFDIRDQPQIYKMMVASVMSLAAVGLGEPDPAVFNAVDGPDMNAVRSDHFHMLLYADFKSLHARPGSSEFIALFGQEIKLRLLVGDTLRRQLLDRAAGIGGRLLDQFDEVFPYCSDALIDLSDAQRNVGHGSSPRHRSCAIGISRAR